VRKAKCTVPMAKQNFFKFWWDEICQALKDESIAKHRSWIVAGRPRDGPIAGAMRKAKYDYKMYLKRQCSEERKCFTNDLHKDFGSLWKTWNGKFGSKFNSQVINGVSSHSGIAEVFGNIYAADARPNSKSVNGNLQQLFQSKYSGYIGADLNTHCSVNVEMVDGAIRDMKCARAAGPDGITAEHLFYSHPLICVLLSVLFRLILLHSFVPDAFGIGMIIPLLKGDDYDCTVADSYRAITISPCISKVLEMCMHSMFRPWLESDDLQFGLKKGGGFRDAIYTLRGVIHHINSHGSTAVVCALDISKAFDKMNHFGLFIKLMDRCVPRCLLDVLINWYSKCFAFVRWGCFV